MAGTADTNSGNGCVYLVGVPVLFTNPTGYCPYTALKQAEDGPLAAIFFTGILVILELVDAIGLHRDIGAIAKTDL